MTRFVKHDDDGRILFAGDVPESQLEYQGDDIVLGEADPKTQYVSNKRIVARPTNPALLVGRVLRNLPKPCQITINGKVYPCNDGIAELAFTYPGTYAITVEAWPYRDAEYEVKQ